VARATEHEDEPRQERLEELVRIEAKVSEAAEAAADAAAHAVEATKAAEAASVARAAKKAKAAETAKAAKVAATAKGKAGASAKAAKKAKAASTDTAFNAPPPSDSTETAQKPTHLLKLRLTDDEREQIERMAAEQDLPVPELARSLLKRALNRSDLD
jgi:peptidyl-prolyl cis-trans isomerase SurA